jgi:hypothetical protein
MPTGSELLRALFLGVLGIGGLGAPAIGLTPTCPVPPQISSPDEDAVKDWLSSKSPFSSDVLITQSYPGKVTETLVEGRIEVATDGTVHYRLAGPPPKTPAAGTANKNGRGPRPEVEFFERGGFLVLVGTERPSDRLKVEDCSAIATTSDSKLRSRAPTKELLSALGGDAESATGRAALVHWTALLGDPRRCIPVEDDLDVTSFSTSNSPVIRTYFKVPTPHLARITGALTVTKGKLRIDWTAKAGIQGAVYELHSTDSPKKADEENYFDVNVSFSAISNAEPPPPPPEVQSKLTPDAAKK